MDTSKSRKEQPPMTVQAIADDPTRVYVLGERGWWYEIRFACESQPASCECEDYLFRGHPCKHIRQAEAFRDLGGIDSAQGEVDQWKQLSEAEKRAVFA